MDHSPIQVPDYSRLGAVRSVPRRRDWSRLSPEEFAAAHGDLPVVLEGVARQWPACRKWNRQFMLATVGADTLVDVRRPMALGDRQQQWAAKIPLGVFARAVESSPGLYLAEWYVHSQVRELFADVQPIPDFLDDDWLARIPCDAFRAIHRNNIYWGAAGSATDCHFDNSNTVTWNATIVGTKRWLLFSGRTFPERTSERMLASQRLVRAGLATAAYSSKFSGFVTVEGIEKYLARQLVDLPEDLTFYWADVAAGDLIYVPWRWFHQVHNLTESMAVSRYYLSRENYVAYMSCVRERSRAATAALRALIGSNGPRRVVGSAGARRLVSRGVGKALFAGALRMAKLT